MSSGEYLRATVTGRIMGFPQKGSDGRLKDYHYMEIEDVKTEPLPKGIISEKSFTNKYTGAVEMRCDEVSNKYCLWSQDNEALFTTGVNGFAIGDLVEADVYILNLKLYTADKRVNNKINLSKHGSLYFILNGKVRKLDRIEKPSKHQQVK